MLGRAAERFIRTTWPDVQTLAEELYATFSPLQAIEASRIIINQAEGDESPPFTINRPSGADGPGIVINRNGGDNNFGDIDIHGSNFGDVNFDYSPNYPGLPSTGETIGLGDFSTGGGGGSGGVDLAGISFPGQEAGSVPLPQDNPVMLYGKIVSKTEDQTYTVDVWAKSPLGPRIGRIQVRFTMIDPNEEIPVDVTCGVLIFPGAIGGGRGILDAVGFVPAFMQEVF